MMKKVYLTLFTFLLCIQGVFAQSSGISFQGIARNASGEPLVNQKITLRFAILQSNESGAVEYQETKEITSNAQGMFSVVIGDGNFLTTTGNFAAIKWKNMPKFLKVEMDAQGGSNFSLMGTSRLEAVPFAYYANGVDATNVEGVLPAEKGGTGVGSISALKSSMQLDKVNNTSDANKPLSTATINALTTKVDKVQGKDLSTNDYSSEEKNKLAAITGTNTGDQDLSGYATADDLNSKVNTSDMTTALATKVDKVQGKDLSTNDYSSEEKNKLAAITGTNTGDQDLSGYATTAELNSKANASDMTTALATKVDKIQGKDLSTNDYTTAEKTKLAAITGTNTGDQDLSGYATTAELNSKANASDMTTALATKVDKVQGKDLSTNDYTTAEKTKLAAITGTNTGDQDLSGFATTADLAAKANASDVTTGLAGKVDKVTGKELSSNDFTNAEKTKLAAITGTNTGDQDLSGYATTANLNSKANASDMTTALATKVDKVQGKELSSNDYTTAEKTKLAAITGTNTGDQDLSGYATTADLATKASSTIVTTGLSLKEDAINKSIQIDLGGQSSSDVFYPSQKAVKTYVDNQINNGLIADGSITSQKIADGTLVNADINSAAEIAFSKLSISKSDIESLGIPGSDTNTTYSAGSGLTLSGTTFSIGSGAITSTEIADATITNSKISGPISVAKGGTGATTFSANRVLLGNGTNPLQEVAPGNSGNVLTSNGTTWTSAAPTNPTTFASDITINGIKIGRGSGNVNGNIALGLNSLNKNTSGYNNTAIGLESGFQITTGRDNTMIGAYADVSSPSLINATAIGYLAKATENNTIRLGNTNVTKLITSGQLVSGIISYPNTAGTNGQVLTTNGTNSATWQNVSTSGSVEIGGGTYGITFLASGGNFTADWANSKLNYMRIGDMVFFNAIIGKFTMNGNQQVEFEFEPPIASAFTTTSDAIGTITAFKDNTNVIVSGAVSANPVYNNSTNSHNFKNTFTVSNANVTDLYISISGSYIVK